MPPRNSEPAMQVDEQQSAEVALINDARLLEQFAEMAVMIPADPGGGTEDIIRKILAATTWDQLDEPWETSSVDDILGKRLRVVSVTRRPSTYNSGLRIFLIVKLVDPRTSKEYVKTTGSASVVAQFARAYALGITAMTIEWCRADRATENGYYPQHLKIHDAATPGNGDAEQ